MALFDPNNRQLTGIKRIAIERWRQVDDEGYDTEDHDCNLNIDFELTKAAICYARQAMLYGCSAWQIMSSEAPGVYVKCMPPDWPATWDPKHWKPEPRGQGHRPFIKKQDAIRMLEKAGALIAAEIDRLLHTPDIDPDKEELARRIEIKNGLIRDYGPTRADTSIEKAAPGSRLKRIAEIIEHVDNRCMAADGPVTPTLEEMRQDEISEIYALAKLDEPAAERSLF